MPITQDRMLSLLEAAEALERYAEELHKDIRRFIKYSDSPDEACVSIIKHLDMCKVPISKTILSERIHFNRFAARNDRERRRQASRRFFSTSEPSHPQPSRSEPSPEPFHLGAKPPHAPDASAVLSNASQRFGGWSQTTAPDPFGLQPPTRTQEDLDDELAQIEALIARTQPKDPAP